jgi:hypothetical protein
MIRHGRTLPDGQMAYRVQDTPVSHPPVSHTDVLRKFIYRLSDDLTPEVRVRLESVIGTYQRLYA